MDGADRLPFRRSRAAKAWTFAAFGVIAATWAVVGIATPPDPCVDTFANVAITDHGSLARGYADTSEELFEDLPSGDVELTGHGVIVRRDGRIIAEGIAAVADDGRWYPTSGRGFNSNTGVPGGCQAY